mmetsp:Transcript_82378/g.129630  ORF Transcript_82378/g.129630 Transcript_82378/m.129630 type:complete len:209 (-) Transcript_82378:101-727(-)
MTCTSEENSIQPFSIYVFNPVFPVSSDGVNHASKKKPLSTSRATESSRWAYSLYHESLGSVDELLTCEGIARFNDVAMSIRSKFQRRLQVASSNICKFGGPPSSSSFQVGGISKTVLPSRRSGGTTTAGKHSYIFSYADVHSSSASTQRPPGRGIMIVHRSCVKPPRRTSLTRREASTKLVGANAMPLHLVQSAAACARAYNPSCCKG